MGLFTSINIASTGLAAERLRSDVISDNIANASTTRTQDGGPYKRSRVIFAPVAEKPIYRTPYLPENLDNGPGKGVRVKQIVKDDSRGTLVYDPDHPDAIKSGPEKGYVEYPNVNIVNEMVDLIASSRAYEANTTVIESAKSMFSAALEIGR
ncbi:MAG: flagellar basal body rod protein FlgC [Treponema sp.]|uniref:flagellar basal body rod protein FlgC n=1 Tax=Treponema sp. TaxID=166 RepID=UPI001B726500|nr:flagellar basal body rod protein FlgC [Treponema sp.]MBP5402383.1 flagellar basal body rod protein FlgC [Treponema sp.]MBR5934172.1 flagellar basal body rod protein FlgC [Treponema sp.]